MSKPDYMCCGGISSQSPLWKCDCRLRRSHDRCWLLPSWSIPGPGALPQLLPVYPHHSKLDVIMIQIRSLCRVADLVRQTKKSSKQLWNTRRSRRRWVTRTMTSTSWNRAPTASIAMGRIPLVWEWGAWRKVEPVARTKPRQHWSLGRRKSRILDPLMGKIMRLCGRKCRSWRKSWKAKAITIMPILWY